jgi:hypothetical protein
MDESAKPRRIENADFSHARLHAPDFEDAKITDGWFANADISGFIGGLRVNGVEVGPLVTAELDRQFPERILLRATDPDGLARAWQTIEEVWSTTVARATRLPDALLSERVDDEWSFVETLRHLVCATDCWLSRMIKGEARPYHPWGLAGPFLTNPSALGLDPTAEPALPELLNVRRSRMDAVRQTIHDLDDDELARMCEPPTTPGHPNEPRTVLQCLHVILDEEWEHSRYANRDLEIIEAREAVRRED